MVASLKRETRANIGKMRRCSLGQQTAASDLRIFWGSAIQDGGGGGREKGGCSQVFGYAYAAPCQG